jgi:Leucine-rich repeat (LRR) protein
VQATTGALQNLTTLGNETVAVAQNVSGLPPAAVMDTAVSTSTGDANLTISLPLDVVTGGDNESSNSSTFSTTIYLGLYFAELNSTATRFSRQFYVQVPAAVAASSSSSNSSNSSSNSSSADPDVLFENPYNISGGALIASQESWQLQYSSSSSSNNSTSDQLLLQQNLFDIVLFPAMNLDVSQPLGPSLNALELLERIDSTATRTNDRDALAIEDIKSCLNLTEWTGDPCLPYPHSWLTCNNVNMTTSPSIIAVDLSGYDLNGTICPSFGNLSSLTSLSLANNELTGPLPSELEDLTNLTTLQVQNNHLTGTLPDWLTSLPLLTLL